MELTESVKIIDKMIAESKRSLHNYSYYFIIWGILMAAAGITEYILKDSDFAWIVWPIGGFVGGIFSFIVGYIQDKKQNVKTTMDRVYAYTWISFGFCLILAITYSLSIERPPHALVLLLAGGATFISGGIAKFKPFIIGGLLIEVGAILCAFLVPFELHGLVMAVAMVLGYLIPGFMLRKKEDGQAK